MDVVAKRRFFGKKYAMRRRMLGLKHWRNQPNGTMLTIAEGNRKVKRKTLAKAERHGKMGDRIKKEKKK